jgi:hypothetical protein
LAKTEQQKAQAQLDHTNKYLKQTQAQVKEAEYFRDKYMAEAREKAAESERLDKEIKEMRATAAQLNDWRNKMLQQTQKTNWKRSRPRSPNWRPKSPRPRARSSP